MLLFPATGIFFYLSLVILSSLFHIACHLTSILGTLIFSCTLPYYLSTFIIFQPITKFSSKSLSFCHSTYHPATYHFFMPYAIINSKSYFFLTLEILSCHLPYIPATHKNNQKNNYFFQQHEQMKSKSSGCWKK